MKGWETVALFVIILFVVATAGFFILQDLQEQKAWESSAWKPPAWASPDWEVAQKQKALESTQEQEATAPTENQAEAYVESNTDYASYLVMTVSPHIIADSYGDRYIVGSFKNISSVELDFVSVSFRLYDKDGNQIGNTNDGVDDLLPGKTWKYETYISEEASYFEFAEINVYIDEK